MPGVSEKRAARASQRCPFCFTALHQYAITENTVNELKIFDAIHHSRSGIYRQPYRRTFGRKAAAVLIARHAHAAAVNRCGLLIKSRAAAAVA